MLDLSIKWTVAAIAAWVITRRAGPANAAPAHRVWLCVLLMPAWWVVGAWLFEAAVLVQVRRTPVSDAAAGMATRLASLLLAAYAAVAIVLLARVAAGVAGAWRVVRRSRPLSGVDLLRVESVVPTLADRVRHGAQALPVTAGFLRPLIFLPPGWQSLPADHLRAILLHEAAHVRRKDPLLALVAAIIEAVFWFHPAAWLAGSRVRWFAEMACDASAGASVGEEQYASALLALASEWRDARAPGHPLLASAGTQVGRRLHLLLDDLERGSRRSTAQRFAPAVLVIGLLGSGLVESGRLSPGVVMGHHPSNHARHLHP
jgi:beta-lactamase regulating signal transducer with metallopeptidase domain